MISFVIPWMIGLTHLKSNCALCWLSSPKKLSHLISYTLPTLPPLNWLKKWSKTLWNWLQICNFWVHFKSWPLQSWNFKELCLVMNIPREIMYHHLEFNNASPFSPNWGSFFAELPFNSLIFSKIIIQIGNVLHILSE